MPLTRLVASVLMLAATGSAQADCKTSFPLKGSVSIAACDPAHGKCSSAAEVAYQYLQKSEDPKDVFTVAIQSSPWRLYDGDMRIITVDEFAALLRNKTKGNRHIDLQASWSDVSPQAGLPSLARQLSTALNNFPVRGKDGFLWVSPNGVLRTTRQAYTMKPTGPYVVGPNDDVMLSLTSGWYMDGEAHFTKERNADGLLRAAAALDIYLLCPERALAAFERSAEIGSTIGAYNAAQMRMTRAGTGDLAAAAALLRKAVAAGDQPSKAALARLEKPRR